MIRKVPTISANEWLKYVGLRKTRQEITIRNVWKRVGINFEIFGEKFGRNIEFYGKNSKFGKIILTGDKRFKMIGNELKLSKTVELTQK